MGTLFRVPEILRYLGHKGEPDEQLDSLIAASCNHLAAIACPRQVSRVLPLSIDGTLVMLGDTAIESPGLARHLSGCQDAIVFAATLGAQVDRHAARLSKTDMSGALVLQAAAASMIECYCDEQEKRLLDEAQRDMLYLKPRFSPGYGGFSIEYQGPILRLLQADKAIGLTETDSHMLTPLKSVTAIIGRTAERQPCSANKCAACPNTDCGFRKD